MGMPTHVFARFNDPAKPLFLVDIQQPTFPTTGQPVNRESLSPPPACVWGLPISRFNCDRNPHTVVAVHCRACRRRRLLSCPCRPSIGGVDSRAGQPSRIVRMAR